MLIIIQIVKPAAGMRHMGHSQAEKAESRERILNAAARQIREGGLESISIAELMKSAGLTHGAFYAHFSSRGALLAAALDRALSDGKQAALEASSSKGVLNLKSIVNSYLSPAHRDAVGEGCAVSSLAGDVSRAEEGVRRVMQDHMERFLAETQLVIGQGAKARRLALSTWSTMVGALALARLFKGDAISDEFLREARAAILDRAQGDSADP